MVVRNKQVCDDEELISNNIRETKLNMPDGKGGVVQKLPCESDRREIRPPQPSAYTPGARRCARSGLRRLGARIPLATSPPPYESYESLWRQCSRR